MAYYQGAQANTEMAWDLRTIYANFIVAPILVEISDARARYDFLAYWKKLNDLYVVIAHKIKPKEKEENFIELKKATQLIIQKYEPAFLGQDHTPENMGKIEEALTKVEMYLYQKMQEADMFGAKKYVEGLM